MDSPEFTVPFDTAAAVFLELVERIEDHHWTMPGLGVWNVRDLVGHTSRAFLTIDLYLSEESDDVNDDERTTEVPDAETYFVKMFSLNTDHEAVARRGIEAGETLGDDPPSTIRQRYARTSEKLAQQHPNRPVSVGLLSIPLDEYLRTRVFELVVHSLDLSRATGLPVNFPVGVLADTAALAARTAALRGTGKEVLLALTGRGSLPDGFSIF